MCGRFTITLTLEELMLHYFIDGPAVPFHVPRYNVAPGQMIPAIINDGETNRLGELKWGLIPSWAKDEKIGYKMINARAETLAEKPAFRTLIQRKRVLIPADGFYEWKAINEGKQPMRIVLKKEIIFSFAGLYDTWISPDGKKITSCTIITTRPNKLMQDIHDRMPVILRREDERIWLDREHQGTHQIMSLLEPYPDEEMEAYPVDKMVGNAKNEIPDCIKPI
jgi:putative SOS response-associated peptidase YedK